MWSESYYSFVFSYLRKFTVPRVLQQLSRTNKKNDIDEYDDEEEEEDDDDENEGGGDGNGYGNGDGKEEGQQNKVCYYIGTRRSSLSRQCSH